MPLEYGADIVGYFNTEVVFVGDVTANPEVTDEAT